MVGNSEESSNQKSLRVFIPRALLGSGKYLLETFTTSEGLCPIKIVWRAGVVEEIEPIENKLSSLSKILLPRFVEPHAHLDKAFTWINHPNLSGTYKNALIANLKEHKHRTVQRVIKNAELALHKALKNGIRVIRSHIDSAGEGADESWEALLYLKSKWKSLIELELVALVPIEYWQTKNGKLLAQRVAKEGGLLGGVVKPPFQKNKCFNSLMKLLDLSEEMNCGIDLHIDESEINPGEGLMQLTNILNIKRHFKNQITCSHASSMSLLPQGCLTKLARKLSLNNVNVIALPLTNAWLLGRKTFATSSVRPLAPIRQLQNAGVDVSVGSDNLQDPWFPLGNLDPISLMSFSLPLAQLAPWDRLGLSPFTTAPARLVGAKWDGLIEIGQPADFVILHGSSWSEVLSNSPKRDVIINGSILHEMQNKLNDIEG